MAAARNLAELAALFLRLGVTAFGGPAAHVAMTRAEVVGRRRWLTDAELLDLFGSGYVLIAFLRADLTERWGWLTEQELIDAVTVGQVTPGPVFTTATFIGYLLHGWTGAVLATVGIFGPGFLFVLATQPLIPKLRASRAASRVLDGIVAASLGLMAAAAWRLAPAAVVDLPTAAVAAASAAALARWNLNTTWLIAGGAAVGWVARSVG